MQNTRKLKKTPEGRPILGPKIQKQELQKVQRWTTIIKETLESNLRDLESISISNSPEGLRKVTKHYTHTKPNNPDMSEPTDERKELGNFKE